MKFVKINVCLYIDTVTGSIITITRNSNYRVNKMVEDEDVQLPGQQDYSIYWNGVSVSEKFKKEQDAADYVYALIKALEKG